MGMDVNLNKRKYDAAADAGAEGEDDALGRWKAQRLSYSSSFDSKGSPSAGWSDWDSSDGRGRREGNTASATSEDEGEGQELDQGVMKCWVCGQEVEELDNGEQSGGWRRVREVSMKGRQARGPMV